MKIQISEVRFVLFGALLITIMNIKLFTYIYEVLEYENQLHYFVLFPVIYFCLLVAIFSLVFFRFIGKILLALFVVITFFSVYFMLNYGVIIDSDMIQNVIKTDIRESTELLGSWKLFGAFILFVLFPLYIIFNTKIVPSRIIARIATFFLALILAFGIFGIFSSKLIPFFRNYNDTRMYNVPFYQIYSLIKFIKNTQVNGEFKKIALDAKLHKTDNKKIFVMIVGETARVANYALDGYMKNNTNMYTEKLIYSNQGVFFNNVTSCGTATAISLPCMFSLSTRNEYKNNEYQENILDVLVRTGVMVSWYGNNSGGCQGVCDRLQTKELYREDYDGFLIDILKEKLQELQFDNNLFIFHLQGSHGPTYYKRYPNEFRKFTPTCDTNDLSKCNEDELYNTYDNTIVYSDYIISEMFKVLENSEYESSLLYVSDHGESLGENGIYLHGMPYLIAPSYQKEIPMMFFSNNKNLVKIAQGRKDSELSHDNLYSTLLGFFGISSETYNKELDFLGE